ncbi:MAG: hypothetical protein ACLTDF_03545 [Coprococcus sp.]
MEHKQMAMKSPQKTARKTYRRRMASVGTTRRKIHSEKYIADYKSTKEKRDTDEQNIDN